jgi:SAM-dependent methyltransferase
MTDSGFPLREQPMLFGEAADIYDRRRPSYPAEIIDAVLDFSGLQDNSPVPVVEVGAGTGKASVLFAARGLSLTCLEPSAAMAAVARRNLEPFPDAKVQETSFEDWRPPANSYGLVYAAQSWHWVSAEARYSQADRALRPQGSLAVFWNVMVRSGDEALQRDLVTAYGGLLNPRWGSGQTERVEINNWVVGEMEATGLFEPGSPTIVRAPWQRSYDTDGWLELLSTQSDHRMLDEEARHGLFDRVRSAVEANGGHVEVDYATVCYLARKLDRSRR